ncbi:MAG: c-type cytochrome [Porticoccaceae bacterium]|nr:c-type cytochrome [Porticoccaceae bacterium]
MKTCLQALILITASFSFTQVAFAQGDAAAGKNKAAACAGCHGTNGNSYPGMGSFPKLADLGEKYLNKQINDIKNGKRNIVEMTGMLDELSEQDIADIAAYYNAQTRTLDGSKDNAKILERGEKLYRAGNLETGVPACTGCHSPAGNGNSPAGYPALGGQSAEYIASQLRAFRTAAHDIEDPTGRNNDEGSVMRGVSAHMSEQEIIAVANYIAGLHQ